MIPLGSYCSETEPRGNLVGVGLGGLQNPGLSATRLAGHKVNSMTRLKVSEVCCGPKELTLSTIGLLYSR